MKQTAVEYLIEQIEELINAGIPQSIYLSIYDLETMEKYLLTPIIMPIMR